ncbi:hypothetical protein ABT344_17510 [Micromonospora carbonacea]|uniref:hypothetical protein n=1 Tax=Micromonospora carbonacea TaxID=47853 RepID=UPI00332A7093
MALGTVLAAPAAAAEAPSCISTSTTTSGIYKEFHADSNCGNQYRIQFIVAYHVDSDCVSIFPGQRKTFIIANGTPAYLDRLDLC